VRKAKAELRAKMSVIASTDIYNQNDDVLFDKKTLEKLRKLDIEELKYQDDEDEEEGGGLQEKDHEEKKTIDDESDSDDEDPELKRFNEMAAGIDEYF